MLPLFCKQQVSLQVLCVLLTLNKYCHKDYMRLLTQAVNTHKHTHGGIKGTFSISVCFQLINFNF